MDKLGTYIGEISFLLNETYTATCIANTLTQMVSFQAEQLKRLLESSPQVVYDLSKQIAKRIMEVDAELALLEPSMDLKSVKQLNLELRDFESREWHKKDEDLKKHIISLQIGDILIAEDTPFPRPPYPPVSCKENWQIVPYNHMLPNYWKQN